MKVTKPLKQTFLIVFSLFTAVLLIVFTCDSIVKNSAAGNTFNNVNTIPHTRVGVLLGTSKYLGNGSVNLYYQYRIDAATELMKMKKIDYLVISGDNSKKTYDEPSDMKASLIKNGIDSTLIYLDYAGFRTYDSMIRLNMVFGQDSVVVISQKFHNERAIYIANKLKMSAFGFNARDVDRYYGFKTMFREKMARVKVILDFVLGVKPRFLGPEVQIPITGHRSTVGGRQ